MNDEYLKKLKEEYMNKLFKEFTFTVDNMLEQYPSDYFGEFFSDEYNMINIRINKIDKTKDLYFYYIELVHDTDGLKNYLAGISGHEVFPNITVLTSNLTVPEEIPENVKSKLKNILLHNKELIKATSYLFKEIPEFKDVGSSITIEKDKITFMLPSLRLAQEIELNYSRTLTP